MPITFKEIEHIYSENTPFSYHALKGVNLKIKDKSFTAIIGQTGSGKSTLIQHINALLLPTSGEINVDEFIITATDKPSKLKPLRKKAGLVFQFPEYQLFEETIEKDIIFGPMNFGVSEEEAKKIARKVLKMVGLNESYLSKSPFELSGGQKRRVAIAGILAMDPDILILDEPTAGLDPQGTNEMMSLFKKINDLGKTIILITHDMNHVLQYCDEVVVVRSNGIYSILDSRGEAVIEAYFQCAYDFSEGFGAVKNEELWGFADTTGTIIIPCSYMAVHSFSEGMAAVKSDGKWGFIDKNGEMAVSGKYDDVISFREGMAAVKSGGKWGFIDYEGNSVCELIYDDVHSFQEGYAAVMANGKWGFIDKDGNICIECCYDAVGNFSEGKAAVRIDHYTSEGVDEWAYINSQEKILIDFYPYDASGDTFFQVGEFKDGMAFVSKTLLCLIDDEGNDIFDNSDFFISKPCYNKDYDVIPGYIYTDYEMTVRKYGLAAKNGVQRISPTFDYIDDMAGKYVIVGNYIEGEYCKGVIELERDNL